MNWFEFKEEFNGERDDFGLTAEQREEQARMLREAIEGEKNSHMTEIFTTD